MTRNIQKALDEVEITYNELIDIAKQMVDDVASDINSLINSISNQNCYSASVDYLRSTMLELSLKSFSFAEIKDKSLLKQECAEALKKERYAKEFNLSEGSIASRENNATINASEEILTEIIYNYVSSLLKTKLDETHRVIDVLKTILMSKISEMKMNQTLSVGEVGEKTYLAE